MTKIVKISNLKLLESYLQVNFLKGFKYIDKAGEVLNRYQTDKGLITYDMNPNRLLIFNPCSRINELRISNTDFWCHYIEPANLGEVSRTYLEEAIEVLKITQVNDVLRVGWRNFYVSELPDETKDINRLTNLTSGSVREIQVGLDFNSNIKSSFILKLLKKKDDKNKLAILFDIDTFIEKEIEVNELKQNYDELKKAIEGDKTKDLINQVFKLMK